MQELTLDLDVLPATDEPGQWAMQAILALRARQGSAATAAYHRALALRPSQSDTWSNLAAFALMAGNSAKGKEHALTALSATPGHAGARNNLAVAELGLGESEQALQILTQAAAEPNASAKAMANLGYLLSKRMEFAQAGLWLDRALTAAPDSKRAHLERARVARFEGHVMLSRRHALRALALQSRALPERLAPLANATTAKLGTRGGQLLCDTHDVLVASGQAFHLMAGTLLALVRDGDLLPNDKDIDLAVPGDCDRQALLLAFDRDPRFRVPARPPEVSLESLWAVGIIHEATGLGVDLFFYQPEDGRIRFGLGAPPTILYGLVRSYEIGSLRWQGRDWPIPDPPEQYLEDIYGTDWRTPDPYFDTVVSNPSRAPESVSLAVAMGLLRLAAAVDDRDWGRADSLCTQLLAREALVEVAQLQQQLRSRGIGRVQ